MLSFSSCPFALSFFFVANIMVDTPLVMEGSSHLDGTSRSSSRDEIEDEQAEAEMRNKLNRDFQNFVKRVEEVSAQSGTELEFDIPYPISSHLISSHPIPSHPIPSHPIPSHPIPSRPVHLDTLSLFLLSYETR